MEKIKYIDLFSGIGGFHQALDKLKNENVVDTECVFASEIDKFAIETYYENYKIDSNHNITDVKPEDLPHYNLLCAGFPCQTFSKAGSQMGFQDETKGTLFFEIERLLNYRVNKNDPVKYIILENVANLVTHDNGNTWKTIKLHLEAIGYILPTDPIILSPHQLGIPQLRSRVFIIGIHKSFSNSLDIDISGLPDRKEKNITNIKDIIDTSDIKNKSKYKLSKEEENILIMWDEFKNGLLKDSKIGFPIWLDELRETYDLKIHKKWKADIILRNRELYERNKEFIDRWFESNAELLESTIPTKRKFEWQAGEDIDTIFDGIIQFRPSGIRIKRPTEAPALVAMVHVPIYGPLKRRLTIKEVARLQSFGDGFIYNQNDFQAYKQFGNSVNVDVVYYLLNKLLKN